MGCIRLSFSYRVQCSYPNPHSMVYVYYTSNFSAVCRWWQTSRQFITGETSIIHVPRSSRSSTTETFVCWYRSFDRFCWLTFYCLVRKFMKRTPALWEKTRVNIDKVYFELQGVPEELKDIWKFCSLKSRLGYQVTSEFFYIGFYMKVSNFLTNLMLTV